jgi:hypothetical protein
MSSANAPAMAAGKHAPVSHGLHLLAWVVRLNAVESSLVTSPPGTSPAARKYLSTAKLVALFGSGSTRVHVLVLKEV